MFSSIKFSGIIVNFCFSRATRSKSEGPTAAPVIVNGNATEAPRQKKISVANMFLPPNNEEPVRPE